MTHLDHLGHSERVLGDVALALLASGPARLGVFCFERTLLFLSHLFLFLYRYSFYTSSGVPRAPADIRILISVILPYSISTYIQIRYPQSMSRETIIINYYLILIT